MFFTNMPTYYMNISINDTNILLNCISILKNHQTSVCGRAGVRACGRAGVRACGRAGVRACGRAGVRACGREGVRACV